MAELLKTLVGRRKRLPHYAAVSLPADLNHFAVFDQHWHDALPAGASSRMRCAGDGIGLDVVFDKLRPLPLQPLPHLLV